jgi:acetyl-CoA C-acetyltransferase
MSMAPYFLEKPVSDIAWVGHASGSHVRDGLWDIVNDFHMGISNELCSEKYHVSREDQDRYALESYRRSLQAIASGRFDAEIVPVEVPQRKGNPVLFARDECPRETSYEALAAMPSAFKKGGLTTAGNASVISDGAAAVVVMSKTRPPNWAAGSATIGAQASTAST